MRRIQSKLGTAQLMEVWPPVELSCEQIPAGQALQWVAQRIVELKACNLRFVRALDAVEMNVEKLSLEFMRNLEFFGTADGYLTVALEMLRKGNCSAQQVSALFKAVSSLASSLGEARREMLCGIEEKFQTLVLESESRVSVEPKDVEEELAEIRRNDVRARRTKASVCAR